jgi:hypothetical protein
MARPPITSLTIGSEHGRRVEAVIDGASSVTDAIGAVECRGGPLAKLAEDPFLQDAGQQPRDGTLLRDVDLEIGQLASIENAIRIEEGDAREPRRDRHDLVAGLLECAQCRTPIDRLR